MNTNKTFVERLKSAVNEDDKCKAFKDWIEDINENYIAVEDNMKEPEYYASNGLSPIGAFKQGLMSKEEYIGFLKGNIIKYTIRAGKKEDAVRDLEKAKDYINFYIELLEEEI